MTATPKSTANGTIVLIHGLWMTPLSWEKWVHRYQTQGYNVIAPAWPGLDGDVDDLRRDPSSIAGIGLEEVVDHYAEIIRRLDDAPIIMGHSFGGAITQILLDRTLGRAGVAIDSAPVKGVLPLPYSTLKSAWPVLGNPANKNKAITLTPKQFHYSFANTLTEEQSTAAYERYHVPGAARVMFQGAFANFNPRAVTQINFANEHRAPLLFIAGKADHITPPRVNKANWRLYSKSPAVTDYHEFPGRSHFTVGQDGWEQVADYALSWATTEH
ncbi:alpha/beta hydrolase [Streptomyces sp. NBC_01637]|uniref:alpha/beta hydrolase n=1 Tax=unclassified Streptomyces TaxID=2593676 RepID=UPI0038652A91|nr:alpha/beta hydrolase [Streptomyces sp. NBC_01653]WTC84544.1 alpha/beta hydrolase [Streptomyces sp. NBC_01653]WTD86323.1 alpha/beta hydrolase [Streptomyces sp. NBC_01637]WTD94201.1 alpha/beta hydrolase [Streptomyces sp. NBC_01637]